MAAESNNVEERLRPFYQRASEAEERLARLEASLARHKGSLRNQFAPRATSTNSLQMNSSESGNDEHLKLVEELQSQLQNAKAEQLAEREKAMKEIRQLTDANAKLEYRIVHLVRALKEAK